MATQGRRKPKFAMADWEYENQSDEAFEEEMLDALLTGISEYQGDDPEVAEKVAGACALLMGLGLPYEVCGAWVWVDKTEATRQHKDALKEAGFRWGSQKKQWYFPGKRSISKGNHDMDYIRTKYGSWRPGEEA